MPHIIIEYGVEQAEPQRVEELLEAVHRAVAWSGLFDESHIRVRALAYDYYRVAGIRRGFIHTQLRIHKGRNDDEKRRLTAAVLEAIRQLQWPVMSITVEVVDMDRATYAKHVTTNKENNHDKI